MPFLVSPGKMIYARRLVIGHRQGRNTIIDDALGCFARFGVGSITESLHETLFLELLYLRPLYRLDLPRRLQCLPSARRHHVQQ